MKTYTYSIALSACAVSLIGWQVHAETNRVEFPNLDELVHYTTVRRGNVMEHIMTTPEAMEAVKDGRPIPAGTHFVLIDHRDGELYRYFVMEKGEGFGEDYDENRRLAIPMVLAGQVNQHEREYCALSVLSSETGGE